MNPGAWTLATLGGAVLVLWVGYHLGRRVQRAKDRWRALHAHVRMTPLLIRGARDAFLAVAGPVLAVVTLVVVGVAGWLLTR